MELCNINTVKALLEKYGFSFSKALGQNFLRDAEVPCKIAELSGIDKDCTVLEIGPGVGALTARLCERAKNVIAVEIDKRLMPLLSETLKAYQNVEVINADIMKCDIKALISQKKQGERVVACANLPYYITTPVLTALIEADCFESISVMVQKEVALRMCASAGTADYGAFSVYVQYHSKPRILFDVPAECFIPKPKVDSAVVQLEILKKPLFDITDEKLYFKIVRAAFGQRRKTLVNALCSAFGISKAAAEISVAKAGFDVKIRGEKLSPSDFGRLSSVMADII